MKLGLIGGGFMGEAILSAGLARGVLTADGVYVNEVNDERAGYLRGKFGLKAGADPAPAIADRDIILLAVKPQEFEKLGKALKGQLRAGQTLASIMAGVPIAKIQRVAGHQAVVRVMPNTPAAIGAGMSVWMATPDVSDAACAQVAQLLGAMGHDLRVEEEKYLDMATALLGSGPGFIFLLLEAFIDAGVHIGFRRDVAETLALQTFIGAARYAEATGKHPAQLRNEVTSPAGTTAAGLAELESAGVRAAILDAIEAAYERSKELGA